MNRRELTYGICLLATVLLCAACRRESVPAPAGDSISFDVGMAQVSTTPETRAPAAEAPTGQDYLLHENSRIGLYGIRTTPEGEAVNVFSKIPLESQSDKIGGYIWEYSPNQYWRMGNLYDFRAVYPFEAVDALFGADRPDMDIPYSMLSENYDLLVAGATRDLRSTDDRSPVELQFRHALAAVRVVFRRGSDNDPKRHYYLNSFEMQQLHTAGVLAYSGGAVEVNAWSLSGARTETVYPWSAPENVKLEIPQTFDEFKTLSAGETSGWEQWHFVIPQALKNGDGVTPGIRYSVVVEQYKNDGVTLAHRSEEPVYTALALPLEYEDENHDVRDVVWEPGKVYTYYVTIHATYIDFTCTIQPWDTEVSGYQFIVR